MTSKITNIGYSNLKPSTGYRRLYIQNRVTMWYEWAEYNFPTNTQCSSPPRGQTNFKNTPPVTGSTKIETDSVSILNWPHVHTLLIRFKTSIQPNSSSYTVEPHHKEPRGRIQQNPPITRQPRWPQLSTFPCLRAQTQWEIRYNKATSMVPRSPLQRGSTVILTLDIPSAVIRTVVSAIFA